MRFSLLSIIALAVLATGIVLNRTNAIPPPLPHALPRAVTRVAQAEEHRGPTVAKDLPFPSIAAKSAAIVDSATGVLLGEKEKDVTVPIASVTKLMTALVFLDTDPSWERTITMESRDNRPGGTLFVRPGERLTLYDLFMTALVGSANNAAIALVRASAMAEETFAEEMQLRGERMGLTHTRFVEPTGLDRGNISTALDIVRLGWYAFAHPAIREALTAKEHVFITTNTKMRHRVKTTNDLLFAARNGYTIVAAKTGYTHEAGYTFVIEAERDGHRVIVAVLGAPTEEDRFRDAEALIHWAFEKYEW